MVRPIEETRVEELNLTVDASYPGLFDLMTMNDRRHLHFRRHHHRRRHPLLQHQIIGNLHHHQIQIPICHHLLLTDSLQIVDTRHRLH